MTTKHVSLFALLSALMISLSSVVSAQPTAVDWLLYDDSSRESPGITAYNPATGEKIELPIKVEARTIEPSGDGRIAYIQDNDVWVLDVLGDWSTPINITQTPDEQEVHIGWEIDGSLLKYQVGSYPGPYLLYTYDGITVTAVDFGYTLDRNWNEHGWYVSSSQNDEIRWYVWNGREHIDLELPPLPTEPAWHAFLWTPDDHLFITIGYSEQEYGEPIGLTDIFYWNGITVEEVNNPSGDESFILGDWSYDGRLTLYTSENYFDRWYVWDGVSFTPEGVPDTSMLMEINDPAERIRDLAWMPDGRLAIVAEGDPESDSLLGHSFLCADPCVPQLYLWTPQSLQQVTSNDFGGLLVDVHDSGSIAVSDFDGLRVWGVTVYDTNLQSVFHTPVGPYGGSRWSMNGTLSFCRRSDLFIWDGQDTTRLSGETSSRWLMAGSPGLTCSVG